MSNGKYDENVKAEFLINQKIFEPGQQQARFYVIASKSLNALYVGSCLKHFLIRIGEHMSADAYAAEILRQDDVVITILGYCQGDNNYKATKETFEFAFMRHFDGYQNCRFVNIRRN